ncbi:MAG: DUF2029 domain-containing protein [Candidatus Eisenbacteria bacterium]|uniref:DUF2029 domain-containing protein n=1 Tax=Eiseniibacteriota bacterium TaxID=2212470 RepID=A0A849ST83_UNCEI|nr:DUF2029 domain-containing protein [Candidatus Eisenbacteria bacterium]
MFAALSGLGVDDTVAAGASVAFALAGAMWLSGRLAPELDGALRRHTLLAVLWVILGVGAIGATGRLATFMADETKGQNSMYPFDDFFVHHSCLSAHYQSAHLHRDGVPNVYERTLYEGPSGEPKFVGSLVIDVFMYPPPFLLLSRLGLALSENFATWRAVWFGVEGALVAAAFVAVAFWIGGPLGRRVALLSLLAWLSFPTLTTLQHGNFHLAAIAGSVLAMLAFERGRHALGGGLLAALALSKFFPGFLVLFLVFQRRWRAMFWTTGFGVFFVLLAYVVLGGAPFRAFFAYHLPRLSTGATFETLFAHPDVIACNHAMYGLVQKLSLLGVPGMGQGTAIAVSWMYTIALVGIAALAARAAGDGRDASARLRRALLWLAVLQLASLRAPFVPDVYGQFALLWILVLLLAGVEWRGWRPIALLTLIVLANFMVPTVPLMPLPALLGLTLVHQILFIALCLGVVGGVWCRASVREVVVA